MFQGTRQALGSSGHPDQDFLLADAKPLTLLSGGDRKVGCYSEDAKGHKWSVFSLYLLWLLSWCLVALLCGRALLSRVNITRVPCVPIWGLSLPFYELAQEDVTLNPSPASSCFCITSSVWSFSCRLCGMGAYSLCVLQTTWWRRA